MPRCNDCNQELRCRECGALVTRRRKEGTGSFVSKSSPLTKNEQTIFTAFSVAMEKKQDGVTNWEILETLQSLPNFPKREASGDFGSSPAWDYHGVQVETSRLTGRGMLAARKGDGNALVFSYPSAIPLIVPASTS